ncbi:hypothetical protein [Rhizobium sp. BK251]|uniref:hypothetical protein n=1 Tax=Rhizobium sp. BK251 TaxID=2512125 RepID=UPI00104FEF0B|nr:hypothetical protein [Rhizobium sp. BK251]
MRQNVAMHNESSQQCKNGVFLGLKMQIKKGFAGPQQLSRKAFDPAKRPDTRWEHALAVTDLAANTCTETAIPSTPGGLRYPFPNVLRMQPDSQPNAEAWERTSPNWGICPKTADHFW